MNKFEQISLLADEIIDRKLFNGMTKIKYKLHVIYFFLYHIFNFSFLLVVL